MDINHHTAETDTAKYRGQMEDFEITVYPSNLIQVKGKTQPVHMFALIGDDAMALQTAFQEWRQEHDAMLKAYRTRDFEGAFKMIKSCELKSGGRLETLYALYSDRCIEMMKNPPPADWNGVYEAKSK